MLKDPGKVLALVEARVAAIKNLAIEARASYYDEKLVRKGKVELVVAQPTSIFFSALSPTGDMLSAFASSGGTFTFFARGAKDCYTGAACRENVARFLPIPLEVREVVRLASGAVPVLAPAKRTLRWDTRTGAYCVTLKDPGGRVQQLWITHKTGLVVRATLRKKGKLIYDIAFSKVAKVGAHLLPHRIRVKMSLRSLDLKLDVRDAESDSTDITAKTFQLACPAGTDKVALPCRK